MSLHSRYSKRYLHCSPLKFSQFLLVNYLSGREPLVVTTTLSKVVSFTINANVSGTFGTMSQPEAGYVFINNTINGVEIESKNFKRKAIRARAARQPRSIEPSQSLTPLKSASKWNRYQARTKTRQRTRLTTFTLDTSVLEHSDTRNDVLGTNSDSSNEKGGDDNLTTGAARLFKSESEPSSYKKTIPVPSILGGGWAAPFVTLESLSKSYCPLLLEHCTTRSSFSLGQKLRLAHLIPQISPIWRPIFLSSTLAIRLSSVRDGFPWSSLVPRP